MKNKFIKVITVTALAFASSIVLLGNKSVKTADHSIVWKLNTPTALHETNGNWQFIVDDYNRDGQNDLFAICKSGKTGTNHAEIHVLNGADGFKSYLLHQALPFTFDKNWIFLLQKALPLKVTNKNWAFKVADGDGDGVDDLYGIQRAGTKSKKVEVHALSAASAFQGYFIHSATAWKCCGNEWDFEVKKYNHGDKVPDLYGIHKSGDKLKHTEIQILDGANGFSKSLFHKETPLETITKNNFDFCLGNGTLNLYAIKKSGTGSKTTEVHLLGFPNSNPNYPKPAPAENPNDAKRQAIVNEAKNHLGQPYVGAGAGPSSFDCSGFTMYVYKTVLGINLPHHAATQATLGTPVSRNDLLPGDLVFFNNGGKVGHVGIYIGNNQFIHASGSPEKPLYVKISSLSDASYNARYACARRFI